MQKSLLTQEKSGDGQKIRSPVQVSASAVSLDALYQQLHSSPIGLTAEEARKRLNQYEPNESTVVRHGVTIQLVEIVKSWLMRRLK